MTIVVIDGVEYCLEQSPEEDDGDNTNKPSSNNSEIGVASHYKELSIS